MVSIAFGVPLSVYLWRRNNTTKPKSNSVGEDRGANQEYTQNAEGNQSGNQQHSEPNISVHDEVGYPCLYTNACITPQLVQTYLAIE